MRALITAGTTAPAYAVGRLLDPEISVIFGDNGDHPVPGVLPEKFILLPRPSADTFIHDLLTICLDREITRVFPLRRSEIFALRSAKLLFLEFGIRVCLPSINEVSPQNGIAQGKTIVILQDHSIIGVSKGQPPYEPLPEEGIFNFSIESGYSVFTAD